MMQKDTKAFLQARYASRFGEAGSGDIGSTASAAVFASAPGRVELAGNHTDHQGGCTIAAAIDRRVYALAAPNGTDEIHVLMDGFGEASLQLCDLGPRAAEQGTSIALVRGMAAAYARSGGVLRGFDMVTCSDIPVGSGLSSSAAFEVLVGTVIRALCGQPAEAAPDGLTALAFEGVWTEHRYFGKPCGAQDQLASAHGGIAFMDFADDTPRTAPISFDSGACPYALYLVDSRCSHADFTEDYAAVPADMFAVARYLGCPRLEDVPYRMFLERLAEVREKLGDRAALRALHYFEETRRVKAQAEALRNDDFEAFLAYVRLSGASSAQFLQNVSPATDGSGASQPAMVILALCAHLLDGAPAAGKGHGAYRIHGGGFGGSVLAFVPAADASSFQGSMDGLLGYDACMPVSLGARGAHIDWPA